MVNYRFPKIIRPIKSKIWFSKCQKFLEHTQRIVFDHSCLCKCLFSFILTFLTPDVDHVRPKVDLDGYQTKIYQRIVCRFVIYTLWSIGTHVYFFVWLTLSSWKIRSKVSLPQMTGPPRIFPEGAARVGGQRKSASHHFLPLGALAFQKQC